MTKLDIVKLYYNLLIVFAFNNKEIQKALNVKPHHFVVLDWVYNELNIEANMVSKNQSIKLEKVISNFESQMYEIFEEFIVSLINYAASSSISLIKRVKDNFRYFIKKRKDDISNNKVIDQLKISNKEKVEQEKVLVFDPKNNYIIENSIGNSYFIPKPYKHDIRLTNEQTTFIENVITYGDSKPPGFMKTYSGWKYSSIKPMIESFELDTLNEESSIIFNQSRLKDRKEKENILSIDYKRWVLQSWEKRNKKFNDKLKDLHKAFNDIEIPLTSIVGFNWEQVTSSPEYLAQFILSSDSIKLIKWNEFIPIDSEDFHPEFQLWAERNFGSFSHDFDIQLESPEAKKIMFNQLVRKYSTIKYLWMNGIVDRVLCNQFLISQLEFLKDFYSRDPLNKFRENVVGWQISPIWSSQLIEYYPFEAILRVKGAYPRLVILERFEALSSHPDMIKLQSFDKLLGWYSSFIKESKGIKNLYNV